MVTGGPAAPKRRPVFCCPPFENSTGTQTPDSATLRNQSIFLFPLSCSVSASPTRPPAAHPITSSTTAPHRTAQRTPRARSTEDHTTPSPTQAEGWPLFLPPSALPLQQYVISTGPAPTFHSSHPSELSQRRPRQHGRPVGQPGHPPTALISLLDKTWHCRLRIPSSHSFVQQPVQCGRPRIR